jgi:hypothetical protein
MQGKQAIEEPAHPVAVIGRDRTRPGYPAGGAGPATAPGRGRCATRWQVL